MPSSVLVALPAAVLLAVHRVPLLRRGALGRRGAPRLRRSPSGPAAHRSLHQEDALPHREPEPPGAWCNHPVLRAARRGFGRGPPREEGFSAGCDRQGTCIPLRGGIHEFQHPYSSRAGSFSRSPRVATPPASCSASSTSCGPRTHAARVRASYPSTCPSPPHTRPRTARSACPHPLTRAIEAYPVCKSTSVTR